MCIKLYFSRRSVVASSARPEMYVLSSTILQVVFRGFRSGEFADPSSFGIKFKLQIRHGFLPFVGYISPYRCAGYFDGVKLKLFSLSFLLNYYAYT